MKSDADLNPALKYRNKFKGISIMWLWWWTSWVGILQAKHDNFTGHSSMQRGSKILLYPKLTFLKAVHMKGYILHFSCCMDCTVNFQ